MCTCFYDSICKCDTEGGCILSPPCIRRFTLIFLLSITSTPCNNATILYNLARSPTRSSLKITNRSFRYAAPCLWNELPTDLREPRQTQSPALPPITHDSSSSSPSPLSPLASSLTRSEFYSELKTWLFSKSFPP